jgi:hypothetical protein
MITRNVHKPYVHYSGEDKYRKATLETVIVDRRPITASSIYARYNQGDSLYAKKLTYVMNEVFPKLKRKEEVTQ